MIKRSVILVCLIVVIMLNMVNCIFAVDDVDIGASIQIYANNYGEEAKIRFFYDEPGPAMYLNSEEKFSIGLYNIPNTEKENIKFKIENENIAKITKIEYDKAWADAIATVKYLSIGETKLIATLNYNGVEYKDTYTIEVKKSSSEEAGIRFFYDEPGPAMYLNSEEKYSIGLYNIPNTEKENIKFKIENENIAKITKIEYDKAWADAIATVKYLSIGETKLIATLNYNGVEYKDTYTIEVKKSSSEEAGIRFFYDEPGPAMYLNSEEKYSIGLYNIPNTEKENIKFKIENENIAKITKIEYDKAWADAIATVKYLSIGETKLIATLNYNGVEYKDTYTIIVNDEDQKVGIGASIQIYANNYGEESSTINVEDSLKLKAEKVEISLDKPVTWKSSQEKVATVDENGVVTAKGEGTTTIEARINNNGVEYKDTYTVIVINRNTWKNASEWAETELDKANKMEIIPNKLKYADLTANITRAEFAHVAVKLYEKLTGNKAIAVPNNPFIDTADEEVLKAYNLEITKGTSEVTFNPDDLITREQMATMMTRALKKAGINTNSDGIKAKFNDHNDISEYAIESVYFMSTNDIIKGVGDNTFNSKGNATREQALLISERSAEKFSR